jgi:hypothetical protein
MEVDFVVETGGQLIPIEAKLSSTPLPAMAAGIQVFRNDFGKKAGRGFVIHPGEVRTALAPDVTAWPFKEM